jgi:hypothetical protein
MEIANEIMGGFQRNTQTQPVDDPTVLAAAERFYGRDQGEHLAGDRQGLVDRCIAYLINNFAISTRAAEDVAMQVISEIQSAGVQVFIDIERSTSQMVVLRDASLQKNHLVTVSDLLLLIRARSPPHDRRPDSTRRAHP